jgi:hypothetical protein
MSQLSGPERFSPDHLAFSIQIVQEVKGQHMNGLQHALQYA